MALPLQKIVIKLAFQNPDPMQLKTNVRLADLKPQCVLAIIVANDVYKLFDKELVVTSIDDSVHHAGSLHPSGFAFDLRSSYFTSQQIQFVLAALKASLTTDFDIIFETDHFHIEYDPK